MSRLVDAVMYDGKGEITFEQKGIEVPDDGWSDRAVTICANKYFRPEQKSIEGMIDRTLDTVIHYNPQLEEHREGMKTIAIEQRGFFNTPYWINMWMGNKFLQSSACQPYNALISTPYGLRKIGDLVSQKMVGSEVFSDSGVCKIVAVKENGKKRVFRISLGTGLQIEATGDHVVLASNYRYFPENRSDNWKKVSDLRKGMFMLIPANNSSRNCDSNSKDIAFAGIVGWLQTDGFVSKKKKGYCASNIVEFETINEDEFGYIRKLLQIADIQGGNVIDVEVADKSLRYRRIRFYGERFTQFIDKYELYKRKLDKVVPDVIMESSSDEIIDIYLKSVFQADGYISKKDRGGFVGIGSISEAFIRGIASLLVKRGIIPRYLRKKESRHNRHDSHILTIAYKENLKKFRDIIGFVSNIKIDKLDVIINRAYKEMRNPVVSSIVDIEDIGEMDVFDIQTENGTYLANGVVVHNCFILGLKDNMEDILEKSRIEGEVYRHGSGVGISYSDIRESGARLSGGGMASGPIPFMEIGDSMGAVVKSGGRSRRAAKSCILKDDHPDIEDFIVLKMNEELKAKALIEYDKTSGGKYGWDDGTFESEAYKTVKHQNANHSVNASDTFMELVSGDKKDDWDLITRDKAKENKVVRSIHAKELFRKIAISAHACADPGLLFGDTMNRFNTVPSKGLINNGNPCMEFLFIDDSACNLASLNMLKYMIKTGDGAWIVDHELLKQDTELFIRYMDGLIDMSYFPYEELESNSREFRPLGLGFANIGATLMTMGLSYDSDEARSFVGDIVKFMTITAWKTSAKLAHELGTNMKEEYQKSIAKVLKKQGVEVEGPFRNAQVTLMAPTGTVAFALDADTTGVEPLFALIYYKRMVGGSIFEIVPDCVGDGLENLGYDRKLGGKYIKDNGTLKGFVSKEHESVFHVADNTKDTSFVIEPMGHLRMMSSIQKWISGSISKCVTGDTLVCTEKGIIPIEDLSDNRKEDTFNSLNLGVASLSGENNASEFYYNGIKECYEVTLRSGHKIKGTTVHPLMTMGDDSKIKWVQLADLKVGDYVGIKLGDDLWSKDYVKLDTSKSQLYGSQKTINYPEILDEDLAFLLGCLASDGQVCTKSPYTVYVHNPYEDLLVKVGDIILDKFGLKPKLVNDGHRCAKIGVNSKSLVNFLKQFNVRKTISDSILQSPKSVIKSYLSGLFLDGYISIINRKVAICLKENLILDRLQVILNNLGYYNSRISKYNKEYDHYYDEVYMTGTHAKDFAESIMWHEDHKQKLVSKMLIGGVSTMDIIPSPLCNIAKGMTDPSYFMRDKRTKNLSWKKAKELDISVGDIRKIIKNNIHFVPIQCIKNIGEQEVMDITVPETHSFIANGFVNHNTVNIPNSYTVEDIENIYIQAWKMGLKGIAIYRSGSKSFAPLSTDTEETVEINIDNAISDINKDRQKLPDTRLSITHKFKVGGHKEYLTMGFYPDGSLLNPPLIREIFITAGKEGSLVRSLMDMFATSVSIGLQYSGDEIMDDFIRKFEYTKFEPSGFTSNEDIRSASSIIDYIFKYIKSLRGKNLLSILTENGYLSGDELGNLPLKIEESDTDRETRETQEQNRIEIESEKQDFDDATICTLCGGTAVRSGACYRCLDCFNDTGCG